MPQKEKISRIAITGMCGEWGKILADALTKKNPFECVLGLDIKEPAFTFPNFHFQKIFLTDKKNLILSLQKHKIQAVVHLAFLISTQTKISDVMQVNVDAARNVAEAVYDLGMKKFVLGSSTTVYGAFLRRKKIIVTENTPVHPNKDYSFAVLKAAVEDAVQYVFDGSRPIDCVILRRAQLLSPYSKIILPFGLNALPFSLTFLGSNAPLQLIHAKDLSALTLLAVTKKANGIYNAVADGAIRLSELVNALGKIPVPVHPLAAKFGLSLLSLAGATGELSGGINYFIEPPRCSNEKIKKEFRYTFQYSAQEAVKQTVQPV